ncbi:oxysterol-binding protein-related protein 10 isoform X2 [Clarias gariepinus]|uniref:oxysterol-binding protein-related protein 10 isoform X2 n=1 Tax=Clarias gariepinus TaxID=13013 RepID=UPI00234E1AE8|nr:oxysterol-binding protein-related protein 10 isoform X2 [Clarias gariepinus]
MEKCGAARCGSAGKRSVSVERGRRAAAVAAASGAPARPGAPASQSCSGKAEQNPRRGLEGVLNKYTNLLQGWQHRYFVLDPELGQLQYFLNEQSKTQKPRGSLPLLGSSVAPSDEFPFMFTVYAVNGELFKLRACDAFERQQWMTQLQLCARRHSEGSAKGCSLSSASSSSTGSRTRSCSLLPHPVPSSSSTATQRQNLPHGHGTPSSIITITHHKSPTSGHRACSHNPARLHHVKEVMSQAEGQQKNLLHSIESLPSRGPLSSLDPDLLLLKATSAATLSCLGECLSILQHNVTQAARNITTHTPGLNTDCNSGWSGPKPTTDEPVENGSVMGLSTSTTNKTSPSPAHRSKEVHKHSEHSSANTLDPSEERTDTEDNEEEDLGVLDDQRSIILHLLSQLKLGMDLTRVVLPTFILEKRSLLEMYANFMAHPDMFLAITAGATPEERIVRFVEYYLTAFHEGRKGAVAKKPYNPILGESFLCSWDVPREKVRPLRTNTSVTVPSSTPPSSANPAHCYRLHFVAEQVSHHPPVSGFYCECKERGMCVNAHVWTKSKFMGMSVGVSMVGEGVLHLLEHEEQYVFTLPCAYARSILTVPWVELGGKVSICCAKTGYSATVTFHTKPFYGGKVHRVTAEVKHNPTSTIVCKAQGEWNGTLEFTYSSGETKVIDTSRLPVIKKRIRPLEKQGQYESRRLWQHVTAALKAGDIDTATEHKHQLEERQRSEEKQRAATNTAWKPKYFIKEGEGWVYHNPLWKTNC